MIKIPCMKFSELITLIKYYIKMFVVWKDTGEIGRQHVRYSTEKWLNKCSRLLSGFAWGMSSYDLSDFLYLLNFL